MTSRGNSFHRTQRGGVILVTVTLLLIIASLVTLYTARVQMFEHQILLNQLNHKMASLAAQSDLNQAVATIALTPSERESSTPWQHIAKSLTVDVVQGDSVFGQYQKIGLHVQAQSPDGLGRASLFEQYVLSPLLVNVPPVPLMVSHGVADRLRARIVTTNHAAGPLSVWSNAAVDWHPDSLSCLAAVAKVGDCERLSLSKGVAFASDIYANSPDFPDSLTGYLFNLQSFSELADVVQPRHTTCEDLVALNSQIIWVREDCELLAMQQLGSALQPHLVIVESGHVELAEHAAIYGLVLLYGPDQTSIRMHHSAVIEGAVVSIGAMGLTPANLNLYYNRDLLSRLVNQPSLALLAKVPGSWRDFP